MKIIVLKTEHSAENGPLKKLFRENCFRTNLVIIAEQASSTFFFCEKEF